MLLAGARHGAFGPRGRCLGLGETRLCVMQLRHCTNLARLRRCHIACARLGVTQRVTHRLEPAVGELGGGPATLGHVHAPFAQRRLGPRDGLHRAFGIRSRGAGARVQPQRPGHRRRVVEGAAHRSQPVGGPFGDDIRRLLGACAQQGAGGFVVGGTARTSRAHLTGARRVLESVAAFGDLTDDGAQTLG